MRHFAVALLVLVAAAQPGPLFAAEKSADAGHIRQDIANHRAMAEAHLNAAKCLEAGRPEKECQAQLAKDCKGLGIGKYCGMRHKH